MVGGGLEQFSLIRGKLKVFSCFVGEAGVLGTFLVEGVPSVCHGHFLVFMELFFM